MTEQEEDVLEPRMSEAGLPSPIALNRLNPFAIPLSQGGASLALGLRSGSLSAGFGPSPDPDDFFAQRSAKAAPSFGPAPLVKRIHEHIGRHGQVTRIVVR